MLSVDASSKLGCWGGIVSCDNSILCVKSDEEDVVDTAQH